MKRGDSEKGRKDTKITSRGPSCHQRGSAWEEGARSQWSHSTLGQTHSCVGGITALRITGSDITMFWGSARLVTSASDSYLIHGAYSDSFRVEKEEKS